MLGAADLAVPTARVRHVDCVVVPLSWPYVALDRFGGLLEEALMRTTLEVTFLREGASVGDPQLFNVVNADPDWTDWLQDKWQDVAGLIAAAYLYFKGGKAGEAAASTLAQKAFEDLIKSVDSSYARKAEASFPQDGRIAGIDGGADEVQVLFQADSGDDLQANKCFGNVVPAEPVQDLGESRPDRFHYTHRMGLPLGELVPGHYVLGFGAADKGEAIDVSVSSLLDVTVTEAPIQLDVFFVGQDGALYVDWVVDAGDWSGAVRISDPNLAPPGAAVTAAKQSPVQLDVFFVGQDGALYVSWVVEAGNWETARISDPNLARPGAAVTAAKQFGL
jgi:hypothetical protein